VIGVLGFLVVRPQAVVADDPAGTLAAVRSAELLTGMSISLEVGIVLTQALAALWLFRLFHSVSSVMASAVLAFGMVNAVMILVSAAMLTTMRAAALEPSRGAHAETIVATTTSVSESLWAVFFGPWLIPSGCSCFVLAGCLPRSAGSLSQTVSATRSVPSRPRCCPNRPCSPRRCGSPPTSENSGSPGTS
jgi:Domain of unknown function (DUF4386)